MLKKDFGWNQGWNFLTFLIACYAAHCATRNSFGNLKLVRSIPALSGAETGTVVRFLR